MQNLFRFSKLGLRLVILVAVVTAANLGCASSPTSQPDATKTKLIQGFPSQVVTLPPIETANPSSDAKKLATVTPSADIVGEIIGKVDKDRPIETANPSSDAKKLATVTPSADIVREMIGKVDKDRALNDLRQLTGDTPICTSQGCYTILNRQTGSEGLQWGENYLYEVLASLGYSVEFRDWSRGSRADQNLIARKLGVLHPEEEVYFVAHLDGVKMDDGVRFPAADDNASGAVDLLELARVISDYSFSRTVVVFFDTGEEQDGRAASSYLNQLSSKELSAIRDVIVIDMVGYDANRDGVMELWSGDHAPSMALTQVISATIQAYQLNLKPKFVTGCN
jgi:hypothetical protein